MGCYLPPRSKDCIFSATWKCWCELCDVPSFQGQIKAAKRRVVMASLYLGTGPLEQELVRLRGSRPGGAGRCLQTSRCAAPGAGGERPFLDPVAWPALALVAPILGRSGGRGGHGEAQPWPLTLLVSVPLAPHRVPAAPEAASGGGVLWCRLLSVDGVCPGRGVPGRGHGRHVGRS